jgi:hypothetical protein
MPSSYSTQTGEEESRAVLLTPYLSTGARQEKSQRESIQSQQNFAQRLHSSPYPTQETQAPSTPQGAAGASDSAISQDALSLRSLSQELASNSASVANLEEEASQTESLSVYQRKRLLGEIQQLEEELQETQAHLRALEQKLQ